jgi:DNA polymerase III subunit delta
VNPKQLQKHIASASFYPVYLLFGEEEYFIDQYVSMLVKGALGYGDESFNLDSFYGSDSQAADVVAVANGFPVMAERRVVVVKEADKIANTDPLPGYLKSPLDQTVLILVAGEIPRIKRKAKGKKFNFFSFLESSSGPNSAIVEFKKLTEASMSDWIQEELKAKGKSIGHEAIAAIIALKGLSAREISSELEKITTALKDQDEISKEDVLEYLGASKKYNIFELSAKVLEADTAASQEIAMNLLESESPLAITGYLFREFAIVWRIANHHVSGRPGDDDARKVGLVWQWQYSDKAQYAKYFREAGQFEKCFEALLAADVELKSRPTDKRTVVARLIHQLTSSR